MQGWLDGCATLGPKIGFRTKLKLNSTRQCLQDSYRQKCLNVFHKKPPNLCKHEKERLNGI